MKRKYHFETLQIHAGQEQPDPATGARAVPVYQTTAYVFDSPESAEARFSLSEPGNIYSRLTNPTQEVFEKRMTALEGGVGALATASGAAALAYIFQALAKADDHIVASKTIYGGTYNYLRHTLAEHGVETTFVDPDDPAEFESAIQENTKLLFFETLGNPNSNPVDIRALAEIAHRHSIVLVADATFTTPYLLRVFDYGVDIVAHSATKFLGGHGTTLGGVIVDSGKFDWKKSGKFPQLSEPNESYHGINFCEAAGSAAFITYVRAVLLRDSGAALSPFNAFLLLQGLETLSLRMDKHIENTKRVLEYLSNHPMVKKINHPSLQPKYQKIYNEYFPNGAGSIFTFDIDGGEKEAKDFIRNLKIFSLLANVADVKSLVIHPKTTTHSQLPESELEKQGIFDSTIRLSIGTENADDLIADLGGAFGAITKQER